MRTTTGIAIVSNAVIRKYGLKLKEKHQIDPSDFNLYFFFYESPPDSIGIVRRPRYVKETRRESVYLHYSRDKLGFPFWMMGGLDDAKVYIHHPKEDEIIDMIEKLNRFLDDFRDILDS